MRIYKSTLIVLVSISTALFGASFQGIGMPASGVPYFEAISSNYTLVGRNPNWVWSGGTYTVPSFPGLITALSDDGLTIVSGEFGYGNLFYRTIGGATEIISGIAGFAYTTPYGISADGSKIVGNTRSPQMLGWVYENGSYNLLPLPVWGQGTDSLKISSDGSIIAGGVWGSTGEGHIVLWENDNMNVLSNPAGVNSAFLRALSGDGLTVAGGYYDSFHNRQVYVWRNGNIDMLPLLTGATSAVATAVSFDGSLVFGNLLDSSENSIGSFVWDDINGTRLLKDFLEDDYGIDLTGWNLMSVSATDASGNIITGYGINPQGQGELWIATIPEPATIALFAFGGLMMRRKALGI